jgi:hypothetical protein
MDEDEDRRQRKRNEESIQAVEAAVAESKEEEKVEKEPIDSVKIDLHCQVCGRGVATFDKPIWHKDSHFNFGLPVCPRCTKRKEEKATDYSPWFKAFDDMAKIRDERDELLAQVEAVLESVLAGGLSWLEDSEFPNAMRALKATVEKIRGEKDKK